MQSAVSCHWRHLDYACAIISQQGFRKYQAFNEGWCGHVPGLEKEVFKTALMNGVRIVTNGEEATRDTQHRSM